MLGSSTQVSRLATCSTHAIPREGRQQQLQLLPPPSAAYLHNGHGSAGCETQSKRLQTESSLPSPSEHTTLHQISTSPCRPAPLLSLSPCAPMMRGYFTKITYRCRIQYRIRILPDTYPGRIRNFCHLNK